MDVWEKDEVKGLLLNHWLEDLREDRAPQVLPEMTLLTAAEVDEVLQLARWYKAILHPSEPRIDADRLAHDLRTAVRRDRGATQTAVAELVESAQTFGDLYQSRAAPPYLAGPLLLVASRIYDTASSDWY